MHRYGRDVLYDLLCFPGPSTVTGRHLYIVGCNVDSNQRMDEPTASVKLNTDLSLPLLSVIMDVDDLGRLAFIKFHCLEEPSSAIESSAHPTYLSNTPSLK